MKSKLFNSLLLFTLFGIALGDTIPGKVILFNILSIFRVALAAMGLIYIFKAYIQAQKEQVN